MLDPEQTRVTVAVVAGCAIEGLKHTCTLEKQTAIVHVRHADAAMQLHCLVRHVVQDLTAECLAQ